jgi:hypothetical protein
MYHCLNILLSMHSKFQQLHISYTHSIMGKYHPYQNEMNIPGGAAIMSLNQWASWVISSQSDPRGQGSYTATTYTARIRLR